MSLDPPRLILLHGWGMNRHIWHHIRQQLLAKCKDLQVLTPDLPGYAASDAVEQFFSVDDMARQLQPVLSEQHKNIVLGWSLGGLVAIAMSKLFPQRVQQLILVASTPKFIRSNDWPEALDEKLFHDFAHALQTDIGKTIRRFIAIQTMGSQNARKDMKQILKLIEAQGYASKATLANGLDNLLHTDYRQLLPQLPVMPQFILGEHDTLVPARSLQAYARQHQFPLTLISGAGHAPFISHPQVFVQLLLEHLNHGR